MLTEHRTNTKVITYPMFPIERSLEKKYRGIAYPKKQITHIYSLYTIYILLCGPGIKNIAHSYG